MGKTFQDFVAEAKTRIQEVTPQEVEAALAEGEPLVLLDVREPNEYLEGHLPGAVLVPRGVLEMGAPQAAPDPAARVIAYCAGGMRSALAADTLQEMGYTNVASMSGGFRTWLQAGLKVVTD